MKLFFKVVSVAGGLLVLAGSFLISTAHSEQAAKTKICHKPGTPAEKELMVPADAVAGHLAHGDRLGSCGKGR